MLEEELSLNEIARRVGCNASSVMRWRDRWDALGEQGLRIGTLPARPTRVSKQQKYELVQLLLKGPMAFGWRTDVWTTQRVAALIKKEFSTDYHFTHVARILLSLDWSAQKSERVHVVVHL
jgi:transposase